MRVVAAGRRPRPERHRRAILAALLLAAMTPFPAFAQAPPELEATYVMMAAYASTGERCGDLAPWEAATIRAETRRLLSRFDAEHQANLLYTAAAQSAEAICADAGRRAWIDGARAGILREWLPPNLALFRAFATMTAPPLTFIAATRTADLAGAVARIDAQFDAFVRDGILPEGGATWDAYELRVNEAALAMIESLGGRGMFTPDEAAAFIVEATLITGLWLEAQPAP